jgi:hypothetical protein
MLNIGASLAGWLRKRRDGIRNLRQEQLRRYMSCKGAPMFVRFVITLALALAAATAAGRPAHALEPVRPGQDTFIRSAVYADGRLWLLTDAGALSTIAEGGDTRTDVPLPEPALDLWRQDGRAAVVTCPREDCKAWTVRERSAGAWKDIAAIPAEGDSFIAIRPDGAGLVLLTSRRIIEIASGEQRVTMLAPGGRMRGLPVVHVTPAYIFLGFNAGEWGGGMQRIVRKSGAGMVIERNESGELCGGPLNTKCDPVNGIATVPWKPDCIAAAVGLVHFSPSGRIIEVCGDEIRRLYVKPFGQQPPDNELTQRYGEPYSSVAFFGLVQSGDKRLAVGIDGIYETGADGNVQISPLPAFKPAGGISVSFELPGAVLVHTNINRRLSISGSVPLLVPR